MKILLDWLLVEGNYNKYRGKNNDGKKKKQFQDDLAATMTARTLSQRNAKQVASKIGDLESTWKKAYDFENSETGAGILEREGFQSFEGKLLKICPYYRTLEAVFGDRASAAPKLTSDDIASGKKDHDNFLVLSDDDDEETTKQEQDDDDEDLLVAEEDDDDDDFFNTNHLDEDDENEDDEDNNGNKNNSQDSIPGSVNVPAAGAGRRSSSSASNSTTTTPPSNNNHHTNNVVVSTNRSNNKNNNNGKQKSGDNTSSSSKKKKQGGRRSGPNVTLLGDETVSLLREARERTEEFENRRLQLETAKLNLERMKLKGTSCVFDRKQKEANYIMDMIMKYKTLSNEHGMSDERILELFPDMGKLNIIKNNPDNSTTTSRSTSDDIN